jgi:hypothetical protein
MLGINLKMEIFILVSYDNCCQLKIEISCLRIKFQISHFPFFRKSSNMNARVELMQAQMSDLGEQVAQAAMKTDQMMAMMQQILSQQRVRQGTLEISEVNQ